eukprot:scpid97475/ scgid5003/ 
MTVYAIPMLNMHCKLRCVPCAIRQRLSILRSRHSSFRLLGIGVERFWSLSVILCPPWKREESTRVCREVLHRSEAQCSHAWGCALLCTSAQPCAHRPGVAQWSQIWGCTVVTCLGMCSGHMPGAVQCSAPVHSPMLTDLRPSVHLSGVAQW